MSELDLTFPCMGCEFRLMIGDPVRSGTSSAADAAERARRWLEACDERLSRFRPDSELVALNDDPSPVVSCRPLLLSAVQAAIRAAALTGGLVDATLLGEIEAAGYRDSLAGAVPVPLAQALPDTPVRRPAGARTGSRWREIHVDRAAGTVSRPPGLRIDSGGVVKGMAADVVARTLDGHSRFVVDAAGDLAIGGVDARAVPYEVAVEHPLTGEHVHNVRVGEGGIATSGLNSRMWRRADGSIAHHLLDPATGLPAWTGLLMVTAVGPSAFEAETLAKWALLSGPGGARRILERHGGLSVHDDGDVELHGPLRARSSVSVWRAAA
ncbi:MAG TPA: FAD:protein FMN transferase [Solirubrobacteraceae bacterium]|nr:FAD:protein FMN transferase [Solirubrobacteraceae bacterium]